MDDYDISTIEKMCAIKMKIKYDEMSVAFGDKIEGTNVYVPINLTLILSDLLEYKESLVDATGFEIHAAISILNIFAHYKHFFQTKNANHVIILGFVKDNWVYNKSKAILDQVVDYCEFFPNVYMLPKILKDTPQFNRLYLHIVSATMLHMEMALPKTNKSCIFLVSNMVIDRQIMFLFPTKYACTIFKNYMRKTEIIEKTSYMRDIFNKPQYYDESSYKPQLEQMNVLLGAYFGKFNNSSIFKRFGSNSIKFIHNRYTDKIKILSEFLTLEYDINSTNSVSSQFLKCLINLKELEPQYIRKISMFESVYDYRYQNINEINSIIVPILKTWRKKIKDYSLARESESYKLLISHQLFSNWLC